MKRTEDDLRAAFTLAAEQAPATDDVLARLAAAERATAVAAPRRRPATRTWLPVVAVAVMIAAVAVPIAVSTSGNSNKSSSASASVADNAAGAKAASSAAAGSEGFAASSVPSVPGASGIVPLVTAPMCVPSDLRLTLLWTKAGTGGLTGVLSAENISSSVCSLAVKPAVHPLDPNGKRLAVQNVSTAEGYAGPANLAPGATASSKLTWSSWCGAPTGTKAEIEWGTGIATVEVVSGPGAPSCVNGTSGTISSGWFGPLS